MPECLDTVFCFIYKLIFCKFKCLLFINIFGNLFFLYHATFSVSAIPEHIFHGPHRFNKQNHTHHNNVGTMPLMCSQMFINTTHNEGKIQDDVYKQFAGICHTCVSITHLEIAN